MEDSGAMRELRLSLLVAMISGLRAPGPSGAMMFFRLGISGPGGRRPALIGPVVA